MLHSNSVTLSIGQSVRKYVDAKYVREKGLSITCFCSTLLMELILHESILEYQISIKCKILIGHCLKKGLCSFLSKNDKDFCPRS